MSTLQDRLNGFKRTFESGAAPYHASHEAIEKMHRATAELKASGLEERALKVGERAPDFSLFNQDHAQVASVDLLRQGPLVVSFFSRTLVTLLQQASGGSTGNRSRGQVPRSAYLGDYSRA